MMKTIFLFAIISTIASVSYAQTGAVESSLKDFRSAYTSGLIKGDLSPLPKFFDDDVRLMPEVNMTVKGKQNVKLYYEAFSKRFAVSEFTRTPSETIDLGDFVVEWGLFEQHLSLRSSGARLDLRGKYMDIWTKKPGRLMLISQAWNYSHNVEQQDLLRLNDVPVTNVALASHVPINSNITFELAGLNELMESIIIQHDAPRWKMFYTDDGNFLYSRSPVYQGRKEIDTFLDDHVQGLPVFEKLDIRADRVEVSGQYIIEFASHTAFVRGTDWSGVGTGKDVRIWRRGADCSLKIFRHIGMYD